MTVRTSRGQTTKRCLLCGSSVGLVEFQPHMRRCARLTPAQRLRERLSQIEKLPPIQQEPAARTAFFGIKGLRDTEREAILRQSLQDQASTFLNHWYSTIGYHPLT